VLREFFSSSPADRRLLPEGRFSGPMPWVIAIMMFLTILATASGLAINNAAQGMSADLAGKLTIQLIEANPVTRDAQTRAILAEMQKLAAVRGAKLVSEAEMQELLDPWLGADGLDPDLPLPAMIDVDLVRHGKSDIAAVSDAVRAVAPRARVNENVDWLAPLAGLFDALKWLAAALVLLMTMATAATVVLAARASLNTHRETIDVMHLLGATDVQVARLFQRRIALDALLGGAVGLALAIVVMIAISGRIDALGSGLIGSGQLLWWHWLLLVLLPAIGAILATLAARLTVVRALRQML
jgi:cell division transport system permease protein